MKIEFDDWTWRAFEASSDGRTRKFIVEGVGGLSAIVLKSRGDWTSGQEPLEFIYEIESQAMIAARLDGKLVEFSPKGWTLLGCQGWPAEAVSETTHYRDIPRDNRRIVFLFTANNEFITVEFPRPYTGLINRLTQSEAIDFLRNSDSSLQCHSNTFREVPALDAIHKSSEPDEISLASGEVTDREEPLVDIEPANVDAGISHAKRTLPQNSDTTAFELKTAVKNWLALPRKLGGPTEPQHRFVSYLVKGNCRVKPADISIACEFDYDDARDGCRQMVKRIRKRIAKTQPWDIAAEDRGDVVIFKRTEKRP